MMTRRDYTITEQLAAELTEYSKKTGLKKSDIIRRALEAYFAANKEDKKDE